MTRERAPDAEIRPASRPHPSPITICHIVLRLDFGGLENGLVLLINSLPADRYRHVIICLDRATDFRTRIQRPDVTIFELNKRAGNDFGLYRRVWRLLRRLRPDVVHTRNLPTIEMLAPAKLAGVRALIHSEHGLDMVEIGVQPRRYKFLRQLSQIVVDRYLAVSPSLKDWLVSEIGIPDDRISVIFNGVDSTTFRPRDNADAARRAVLPNGFAAADAFVVGAVGRLEPVKDQTNLARAFVYALEQRPDLRGRLRLAVIGDGSLRPEMDAILKEAGMPDLAWMPGFRDDTADCYRAFDLFVLPSRLEGTSNTILEAMASGLPVVATDVGGNPALVTPDVTGRLVPAERPDALGAAILDYADDLSLAAAHGAAGRNRALREFSIKAMVEGYGALYAAVSQSRSAAR